MSPHTVSVPWEAIALCLGFTGVGQEPLGVEGESRGLEDKEDWDAF